MIDGNKPRHYMAHANHASWNKFHYSSFSHSISFSLSPFCLRFWRVILAMTNDTVVCTRTFHSSPAISLLISCVCRNISILSLLFFLAAQQQRGVSWKIKQKFLWHKRLNRETSKSETNTAVYNVLRVLKINFLF